MSRLIAVYDVLKLLPSYSFKGPYRSSNCFPNYWKIGIRQVVLGLSWDDSLLSSRCSKMFSVAYSLEFDKKKLYKLSQALQIIPLIRYDTTASFSHINRSYRSCNQ